MVTHRLPLVCEMVRRHLGFFVVYLDVPACVEYFTTVSIGSVIYKAMFFNLSICTEEAFG